MATRMDKETKKKKEARIKASTDSTTSDIVNTAVAIGTSLAVKQSARKAVANAAAPLVNSIGAVGAAPIVAGVAAVAGVTTIGIGVYKYYNKDQKENQSTTGLKKIEENLETSSNTKTASNDIHNPHPGLTQEEKAMRIADLGLESEDFHKLTEREEAIRNRIKEDADHSNPNVGLTPEEKAMRDKDLGH